MDLTMFGHYRVVMMILALTLGDQVTRGIYGGHEAVPHSRPYMVLVEKHMKNGGTGYCAGFLLNEDFVMTAAGCQADSYIVFLGLHDYHNRSETQVIYVEVAFPHKDYNPETYSNDIMLLKLSTKARFNKNVQQIAIADKDYGSLPTSCVVSGWGRSKDDVFMSLELREVSVTLADDGYCAERDVYCSEGETGPGRGDAGSPLVCGNGQAYGVVSVKRQKEPGGPYIFCYSKIPENREQINWITEQTSYVCVTGVQ